MKAFITGIAGFVGANLASHLVNSGFEVSGLARDTSNLWRLKDLEPKLKLHLGDLNDRDGIMKIIGEIRPNIIYHLGTHGAYHYQDNPVNIFHTALDGTLAVLSAAQEFGVEMVINAGSSSEYGSKSHAMLEDEIIEPNSYYAISKGAQTLLCQFYAKKKNLPTITLRLFSVYGPLEEPGRFIPTAILKALKGEAIPLASRETSRDFIYIDDVVEALIMASGRKDLSGQVFNLGTGENQTLEKTVDCILEKTSSKSKALWGTYQGRPFDTDVWFADMAKTNNLLGFESKHSLNQGIGKMVEWMMDHQFYYDR